MQKVLTNCYCFQNGMVMAFDQNGEQMPDYQGRLEEVQEKIRRDFPAVRIEGAVWSSPARN
jgi:hypothetical protein